MQARFEPAFIISLPGLPDKRYRRTDLDNAFDNDVRIDFFAQDAFQTVFNGHCGMRTSTASALKPQFYVFTIDFNDFQIAAIGL